MDTRLSGRQFGISEEKQFVTKISVYYMKGLSNNEEI